MKVGCGGGGDLEEREVREEIRGSIRYWRGEGRGTEGLEMEQRCVAGG